ncbi:unnamed protein product [Soboliphyme baturini]|uniref:Chorein_N domain-containing protein n=1 Tax=Soboliphyme baturini TaxID=241478 RepID=A0A183ICQ8_9BILA|nr:unnamed protein product [Soboliphyme baturini]
MAQYIKNQIVKHLSRFAKNIAADKITVEVLKGRGELYNIELNELVLTEVLELPAWMRIQRAVCSRIILKVIPWTRLNKSPIVDMFSSDEMSYGFAAHVIEGMSLFINAIEVVFTSEMFGGSLLLSRITVESCNPHWKDASDLRKTRLLEPTQNLVLLFKRISWQTLRLEASTLGSSISTGYNINAPLRLITSLGRCRITSKKSVRDGTLVRGRVSVILDDLLWVATLSELQSAVGFYHFVSSLVQKVAAAKNSTSGTFVFSSKMSSYPSTAADATFRKFDVKESSFHFYIGNVDLHICDEETDKNYPIDWEIRNGAIKLSFTKLAFDAYPYHIAGTQHCFLIRQNLTRFVYFRQLQGTLGILSTGQVSAMDSKQIDWNGGIKINGEPMGHLKFAEDGVLIAESPREIQDALQEVDKERCKVRLKGKPSEQRICKLLSYRRPKSPLMKRLWKK